MSRPHRCTHAGSALVVLAALLGCPRGTTTTPTTPDAEPTPTPTPTLAVCGDVSTKLVDASHTLPEQAGMVAILELEDPELQDALARLSAHARDEPGALTVRSAFSIAQWSWEVPLVRGALARAGFVAGELAAAHFDDAPPLWMLPLGCTFELAVQRLQSDATLSVRDLGDAAIATPTPGSGFPFDVVLRSDAIALVAAGRARVALAAWRRTPPGMGMSAAPPGSVLAELERAPIRVLVRPSGLLDPDATGTDAVERRFRVGAAGVVAIDAPASTSAP